MLHDVPNLRHLGLHGYREMQLEQLPPSVAATLQVLPGGTLPSLHCAPCLGDAASLLMPWPVAFIWTAAHCHAPHLSPCNPTNRCRC